jgi:hypothetical protein
MTTLGPITTLLEAELKRELRQRHLVIWLDKDGHYSRYVDHLVERHAKGDFLAPVVPFRGSYLEMLLALEDYGNGQTPDLLLIHMPGHTEDSIRKTPILELYRAGYRYRRALETLIREAATGQVSPEEINHYLGQGVPDLVGAEAWLTAALTRPQDDLSAYLDSLSLEWIVDSLLGPEPVLKTRVVTETSLALLAQHLHRHTGLDQGFISFYLQKPDYTLGELGETLAAWLMSVEYVHDLTRVPHLEELKPLRALAGSLKKVCDRLIDHLRQRHPDLYASTAAIVELRLEPELSAIQPEDLGRIDTFKGEEMAVLQAGALQALAQGQWQKALDWAQTRLEANSFWLQRDHTRRIEWTLIREAAYLGDTIQRVGRCLEHSSSLRQALAVYTETGYRVDQAHRQLEQYYSKLLETSLPHFNPLQQAADSLRQLYRAWLDQLTSDFSRLCEQEGFLPEADLQQRTLYNQVVHPLTQGQTRVAYFLIDAWRYEMAAELVSELQGPDLTVTLKARYAELPTITAVGMNCLAPVVGSSGRLTLAGTEGFKGFKAGEYTVRSPEDRVRAMGDRSLDHLTSGQRRTRLLKLAEVCEQSTEGLKRSCAKADLLVVHSQEIDDAGEANVGIVTFQRWLQQLKSAWNHLQNIGVNEFVFTADHGFLLLDQPAQKQPYGKKTDPTRRYVVCPERRSEANTVTVSFSQLGYEGQSGYVLFPSTAAVFDTGKAGGTFVHGGNSLQERVIPVLTVSRCRPNSLKLVQYQIEARARSPLLGLRCSRLQVRVKPVPTAQGILEFTGVKRLWLALRVPDRPDITVSIKDAPDAILKNQQVLVELEQDWVDILFDLKGPQDERTRLEIYHPEAAADVLPALLDTYFEVAGSGLTTHPSAVTPEPGGDWSEGLGDPAIAQVFLHLQKHGSMTEIELTQVLGNARQVRRFALNFESYLEKVPFLVRVETTSGGKRYVKELDR